MIRKYDLVVVGAGPAGLAAASSASGRGLTVALVDENPAPGGQIWRRATGNIWLDAVRAGTIETLFGTSVLGVAAPGLLLAEQDGKPIGIQYRKLIVATGARERFLPFPGWTLPNVTGAGGLQALVKGGLDIRGKRVVIAGTGPLLPAVGWYLKGQGADVAMILEQAPWRHVARFAAALLPHPGKLLEAAGLGWRLRFGRYRTDSWVVAAEGDGRVEEVTVQVSGKRFRMRCDYLGCGYGLTPNVELAALAGCGIERGVVTVDQWQQTSMTDIFCAGEPTGIGGVDLALIQGRIAGLAAVGDEAEARRLFPARTRAGRFRDRLEAGFRLRDELRSLADRETLICRCEDVPLWKLEPHASWRAIKLQTRCGMGPCQGRICGPAVEFLKAIPAGSVRPPVYPASLGSLASWGRTIGADDVR